MALYVGLMSGTSMDGVDAALVSFENGAIECLASVTTPYPQKLRQDLLAIIKPDARVSLDDLARLHILVGRSFANAARRLFDESTVGTEKNVVAIGSHGQTLRHSPQSDVPYSLQIGDPATIATQTGIPVVADFRSLDIADGGQGAPLAPAFHEAFFRHKGKCTAVVNIGGIANVSLLPKSVTDPVEGFDTGPGNCLMDDWITVTRERPFDTDGAFAASGRVHGELLNALMQDPFVRCTPPKSTGREHFNLAWLTKIIADHGLTGVSAEDVQATLAEYTAASIAAGINLCRDRPQYVYICGGGSLNSHLMRRLQEHLSWCPVESTAALGADPEMIEACAFAWFAKQRFEGIPLRLTTGGTHDRRILGAIYLPPSPPRKLLSDQ